VISGAKVNLLAEATGTERSLVTNAGGVYTFSSLPIGQYTTSVEAQGFETKKVESFTLQVGETRTLNLALAIGSVSSSVTVVATPDLELSSAVVGGVITSSQTQELPVNGRYWARLEALIPGAISCGTGTQDTIRYSGLSQEDNNFRLDGVDATGLNHAFEKAPLVVQFPMESIAELKGSSALYSADVGGMSGGQINMASKSGTNRFHGSLYEYLRNSYFDAKAFNTTAVSPFHMNNFGVSSGGPIIRNKFFYFANYEAVRQAYDQPFNAYVPSALLIQQVQQNSPALMPLLAAFPQGTESSPDPYANLWFSGGANPTTENGGLLRLDYALSQKTDLSFRFNTDYYTTTQPGLAQNVDTIYSTPNVVLDAVHRFSSSILNDAKVGYNRQAYWNPSEGNSSIYTLTVEPNISYSLNDDSWRIDNSYSFLDDASFYHNRHTLKAGVEIRAEQENKLHPLLEQSLTYNTEQDFINNNLETYTYKPTGVETAARKKNYYGYILDEFKVRPNLTLNFGLRYEYYGVDREKDPSIGQIFDPFTCGLQYCPVGSPFYYPNTLGFEPRISIGWSPDFMHNKTAIRLGFGSVESDGQFGGLYALQTQIGQSFSLSNTTVPGLSFPVTPYLQYAKGSITYSATDQHRKNMQVNQWTLSIQHELLKNTILSGTYVGSKSTHLFNNSLLLNGVNPATGTRPYASLTNATIGWETWIDNSNYNALQIGLKRNMSSGLLISANYQYAHIFSDGGNGGGESDAWENNNCRACERASTDFDIRNNLSASAIWTLPIGRSQLLLNNISPAVNAIIGGWELSGIGIARTGFPLNVTMSRSASALPDEINSNQRPDRVQGVPLYPEHRGVNNWLNPAAFTTPANGQWGNAERNAVRGPGFAQADMGMQKQFHIREQMAFMFRADFFNIFNYDQIGNPAAKWTASSGTFGQITSAFTTNPVGTGTPRQMQFSLRLSY
ncbi:MAG TPA: TonB-dependent receptor, partial [Pseudacidobacterium sp.]|nr:TonB-dependent receptor [Pseudacidobacterium sp.]